MPESSSVVVHGGPELARALDGAKRDLKDMGPVNRRAADVVAKAIAAAAPRVTGALAGSFRASSTGDRATVESDLIYAPVINNGWPAHGIDAQHYAEDGLERSTAAVEKTYSDGVDQICKKAES